MRRLVSRPLEELPRCARDLVGLPVEDARKARA
jgi:hypothetical protein